MKFPPTFAIHVESGTTNERLKHIMVAIQGKERADMGEVAGVSGQGHRTRGCEKNGGQVATRVSHADRTEQLPTLQRANLPVRAASIPTLVDPTQPARLPRPPCSLS